MGVRDPDKHADERRAGLAGGLTRLSDSPASSAVLRWGHVGLVAFWLAAMGVLYVGMSYFMKPKALIVTASGDLKIPRARDGHFYVQGTVSGRPITFLVDTGASSVFVSESFARRAGLPAGDPATFHTANGSIAGRVVKDVEVAVGPLRVSALRVGVGMVGADEDRGLLGQNFLRRFRISITEREMLLQQ